MRKFVRTDADAPTCLTDVITNNSPNWELWGLEWKNAPKGTAFSWKKQAYYESILNKMRELTASHCCFCDKYAPEHDQDTIEHFKPKAQYHLDAYRWDNLFLCCVGCQKIPEGWKAKEKQYGADLYDKILIKPDELTYEFSRYYFFDTKTGNIELLTNLSAEDKTRAELSRMRYHFNDDNRPQARKQVFKHFYDANIDIDELPYRFIFDM